MNITEGLEELEVVGQEVVKRVKKTLEVSKEHERSFDIQLREMELKIHNQQVAYNKLMEDYRELERKHHSLISEVEKLRDSIITISAQYLPKP